MKKLISLLMVLAAIKGQAITYINANYTTTDNFDGSYAISDGNLLDNGTINSNKFDPATLGWISNKVDSASLATVAKTGSYNDLSNKPSIPSVQPIWVTNGISHTIQTVAAASNGFRIDTAHTILVTYSVTITSSSTLSGGASGYVVLEMATSNSSTASDWQEAARVTNGQNNALIVGLGLTQPAGGNMTAVVPQGYYVRLRSANTVGTPTYVFNSGQEVVLQ